MNVKIKPVILAIFYLIGSKVYADGGSQGENGISIKSDGTIINLIGSISLGNPGAVGVGADGKSGSDLQSKSIFLNNEIITGMIGENGEPPSFAAGSSDAGAGGQGGNGGGSVFGGISSGGAGGYANLDNLNVSSANGGNGGNVNGNTVTITESSMTGANGGNGASGGAGGYGGGSVFGGVSTGGAGGNDYSIRGNISNSLNGGRGGNVSENTITIINSSLKGAAGGSAASSLGGGGGAGGYGGGSVFGGISVGGAGGFGDDPAASISANGGDGGESINNTIVLKSTTLTGAVGGSGGLNSFGGNGASGYDGGSVFGGISIGGAAGYAYAPSEFVQGGKGGAVSGNTIIITDSKLTGPVGNGGGSVFGGISIGGAGGIPHNTSEFAKGGNGGDVFNNKITLFGDTKISGDVYGGFSEGGKKGYNSIDGTGGFVKNNTVTIIGDSVSIEGSIFGGKSVNGDGIPNQDATYISYYSGNTLQMQSGHFLLKGSIQNFQNYNWFLPENEFNGDTIITVDSSGTPVNINSTIHKVDVQATGNKLDGGDKVVLISKVTGDFDRANSASYLEQGFFIVYDAEMVVEDVTVNGSTNPGLVLKVIGVNDNIPDGKINPESEEFLKGRIAQLAIVDQGADMISDGISYARASLKKDNSNIFAIVDGGSSKYKNGGVSTLKINDFKGALGVAKAFEFENKSVGMIAAFAEHGNGNYNSYNYFNYFGDTRGSGKVRYSGVGLMSHIDVAGTDTSKINNKPNIFDDKYGLYLDAALRVGHVKVDFHSADMVNGTGVEAHYNTKSRYMSAMVGAGYVWTFNEKSAMNLYGRYTYSRLNEKDIKVIDEQMNAGTAHSKRLRLGARYGYAYSATTIPYAGLAFERNFTGDVSGSAYGFTIKETSLKGNTGILEAGVMIKPKGVDHPLSLLLEVQGYFGQRKGGSIDVRARYVF